MLLRSLPITILITIAATACGGVEEPIEEPTILTPDLFTEREYFDRLGLALDPEGLSIGQGVVRLLSGSSITIINADPARHHIMSDSHGSTDDPCAELNLPVLEPYERITFTISGNGRMCSFHDHLAH